MSTIGPGDYHIQAGQTGEVSGPAAKAPLMGQDPINGLASKEAVQGKLDQEVSSTAKDAGSKGLNQLSQGLPQNAGGMQALLHGLNI